MIVHKQPIRQNFTLSGVSFEKNSNNTVNKICMTMLITFQLVHNQMF